MTLANNTVSFSFEALPSHQKLFVRARVYTECIISQNQTVNLILSGSTPSIATKTLTEFT